MNVGLGSAINTAIAGLNQAESQVNKSARTIATGSSLSSGTPPVDQVSATVSLLEARNSFDANANVLKVGNSLSKRLLDIIS